MRNIGGLDCDGWREREKQMNRDIFRFSGECDTGRKGKERIEDEVQVSGLSDGVNDSAI